MGALLAGSMLLTAMPVAAQYHDHRRHNDRIDAGDVIAGAVVLGGLAAILSASNNRDRYGRDYDPRYDRDYGGYDRDGYGGEWRRTGARQAIEQCVYAAEQRAGYYGGRADVRQITEVERVRGGYQVRGTIAVDDRFGRYDRYDRRSGYDRYDHYDRYGYDDRGRFSCTVRYGRVQDVRVRGLG
jgi:hypothetical protein